MSDNLQTLVLRLLDVGAMESFGTFARVTLASIAETFEQVRVCFVGIRDKYMYSQ